MQVIKIIVLVNSRGDFALKPALFGISMPKMRPLAFTAVSFSFSIHLAVMGISLCSTLSHVDVDEIVMAYVCQYYFVIMAVAGIP